MYISSNRMKKSLVGVRSLSGSYDPLLLSETNGAWCIHPSVTMYLAGFSLHK